MDTRNTRLGRRLFLVYLVLYAAYVLITAVRPATMDMPIAGVNLSIWAGAVLILAAVFLALLYGVMCDGDDEPAASAPEAETTDV